MKFEYLFLRGYQVRLNARLSEIEEALILPEQTLTALI
jgi:hypothetical protein